MRLLSTEELHFEEFFDADIPEYAILSHRWGEKEVSFKEMSKGKALEGPGLNKIKDFCRLAAEDGYDWVWIDTCCIDKKSSAELSEAINSMFRWYKRAQRCYVYLSDVSCERRPQPGSSTYLPFKQSFTRSQWFKRGWTLQELLAPYSVQFFDRDWNRIGAKDELLDEIAEASKIEKCYLTRDNITPACVAEKMSWLSHRTTSRIEDMSYCMLGLFGINMPLLYGEGHRAFIRLQHEILRQSADESIFVFEVENGKWSSFFEGDNELGPLSYPLLAYFPAQFRESGHVRRLPTSPEKILCKMQSDTTEYGAGAQGERPPYSITNRGLKFRIPPHIHKALLDHRWAQIPLKCYRNLSKEVMEGCFLTVYRPRNYDFMGRVSASEFSSVKGQKDPDHDELLLSQSLKWPAVYLKLDR